MSHPRSLSSPRGLLQAAVSPPPAVAWHSPSHRSGHPQSQPRKSIFNLGTTLMPSIADSPPPLPQAHLSLPTHGGEGVSTGTQWRQSSAWVGLGKLACMWGCCP